MTKKYTYGEWLKEWLNVYKKPFVKSVRNQKIIIRLHIPEYVKAQRLSDLNVVDVQRSINTVTHSRTRVDVFNLYHGSLALAYKLRLLPYDMASVLVKPKHQRTTGTALTPKEINEFLARIQSERLKPFYMFCLFTGCRRGEALNVKWEDIDFVKKIIHVHGTKTATSERDIPLLPDCEIVLNGIQRKGAKVFHHRAEHVTKKFKEYCPAHKLHDLRHTFATRCLESGINIKVVQKWLGHSRLDTTAEIYTHVQNDFSAAEAQKFKLT